MTTPLVKLSETEPVEFRCPECSRLICKARAIGEVEIETKCPRSSTLSSALLPSITTSTA